MLCCLQCCAAPTSATSRRLSSALRAATTSVALCNLQRALSIFFKEEGGSCAVLLAVLCSAYLSNKPLAVERFARCNDVGGALQPAESIILF